MTGCNSYDIRQMADDVGCEILHGSSATSKTGLLLFWGDSPRDVQILGINRGPYGGICFLLKHLFVYFINVLCDLLSAFATNRCVFVVTTVSEDVDISYLSGSDQEKTLLEFFFMTSGVTVTFGRGNWAVGTHTEGKTLTAPAVCTTDLLYIL